MPSFCSIIILGHVTRDPELKNLPSGTTVCEFGIAFSRKYKTASGEQKEETCFVDCAAWGKQAEIINQYVTKGKPLMIQGRLKQDTWEDRNGGGKRSKHSVVVENFQLLGGRDAGGDDTDQRPAAQYPQRGKPQRKATQPPFGDEQQFKDDDIPF